MPARGVGFALLLAAVATPSWAGDPPMPPGGSNEPTVTPLDSLRGFRSNEPFLSGEGVDAVNVSNGNLVLTVPLGQRYSVGPLLSYRFRVTHNSDVWDHTRITCEGSSNPQLCNDVFVPVDMAVPNPNSNAGIGWELHFGKLYPPDPPGDAFWADKQTWPNRDADSADSGTRWLYVSPDGASHTLHRLAGRPGVDTEGARYAKDGSQLRMVRPSPGVVEVQHPNGVVSVFEQTNEWAGTNVCGPGEATGCWRLSEMRDPYGNYVRVDYALSGIDEIWTVTDSTSLDPNDRREHRVVFSADPVTPAGGDASPDQLVNGDGSELGDLRRIVKRVELAAFGGETAIYRFHYTNRRMSRGCPSNTDTNGAQGFHEDNLKIRVPVLDEIEFPEGQGFRFDTHHVETEGCHAVNGRIAWLIPPTQGKVAFGYGNWSFPTRCTYVHSDSAVPRLTRLGVLRKEIYPVGASAPESVWSYADSLHYDQLPVDSGMDCSRYDYRETRVDGPVSAGRFTRTVHYTNLYHGPLHPSLSRPIDEPQVTDHGLPYRKVGPEARVGSGESARFLSEEVYDCEVGGGCTRVRRKYVRYEMANRLCTRTHFDLVDSSECYRVDPVLAAERTYFDDDSIPGRYVEKQYFEADGAGNTREQVVLDNFEGSRSVHTSTDYTVTGRVFSADPVTGYFDFGTPSDYLPDTGESWILHPYAEKTVSDGGAEYVTEYEFDEQGSLTCTRRLKDPAGRGADDLITKLERDARGLVTREIVAGGDGGGQSTARCSPRGTTAAGTRFDTVHAYEHLTLASSRRPGFPFSYRADVDRNTGLPAAVYDVADQRTDLDFDRLGRIVGLEPEASLRQARTAVVYFNDPERNPRMDVRLLAPDDTILHRERHWFDHRGRLFQEGTWVTTGGTTLQESLVRRIWDPRGNLTRESTRQARETLNFEWSTRYSDFDALGRARFVRRPDNATESHSYQGVRRQAVTVSVRTSETATTPVDTSTVFDGLGRTIRTVNPVFTLETAYDPAGNVVHLRRIAGSASQERFFEHDNRGFLSVERLPEVGTAGQPLGEVRYTRNALGSPRTRFDGQHWLVFEYDGAGRRTGVTDGLRTLQSWSWGTANQGLDLRKGKVVEAARYNYPGQDPWIFTETYRYAGALGRIDRKTLQLTYPDAGGTPVDGAELAQHYAYDRLGRRASVGYPECVSPGFCNDSADFEGPAHTVSYDHSYGQMMRASSSLGPSATFGYHPNGQLRVAMLGNGTANAFLQGASGMARPRRIQAVRNGTVLFDTGIYRYDGAGNLAEIGDDLYAYDAAGRLRSGTVRHAGPGRREDYRYDAFDNLTGVRRDGSPAWRDLLVDAKNRTAVAGGDDDFQYDGAGNLVYRGKIEVSLATPHEEMVYDPLNMLTRHTRRRQDGTLIREWSYLYGPGNYRVFVLDSETGKRTWRLRDLDGKPLREMSVLGWGPGTGGERWTFERDFLYGAEGLFATLGAGGVERYFHRDHLGSTRLITDGGGARVYEAAFYPYGEEIQLFGVTGEPASKYTGHERDPIGTTDYMLARTYGIDLGRFFSIDPARDGWNLYGYVGGNPVAYSDPTGLAGEPKKEAGIAVEAVGVGALAGAAAEQSRVHALDRAIEQFDRNPDVRAARGTSSARLTSAQRNLLKTGNRLAAKKSTAKAAVRLLGRVAGAASVGLLVADTGNYFIDKSKEADDRQIEEDTKINALTIDEIPTRVILEAAAEEAESRAVSDKDEQRVVEP